MESLRTTRDVAFMFSFRMSSAFTVLMASKRGLVVLRSVMNVLQAGTSKLIREMDTGVSLYKGPSSYS
jgi:hypothetical protein